MLWFALYVIGFLVAAPLIGRSTAKEYEQNGRKRNEASAVSCALVYGALWPVLLVIFAYLSLVDGLKVLPTGRLVAFFRRVLTGTTKTHKPIDRVGTTY